MRNGVNMLPEDLQEVGRLEVPLCELTAGIGHKRLKSLASAD